MSDVGEEAAAGEFQLESDLVDSQSSALSDGKLDALVTDSKPQSTLRCTEWGVRKLMKWTEKRNMTLDLATVDADELNNVLRRFYAEVKSDKRAALSPSALTGIRAALYRALVSPPYLRNINIIVDKEFITANQMFTAKCKLYGKTHSAKPKHKKALEAGDMLKLRDYFADAMANPGKLQEYVWFTLCFHFGRRGREGWREMNKCDFVTKVDSDGKRYVTMVNAEATKNHQGGHKQKEQDYSDVRMYEMKDCALDPVAAVEMYLSKLHPDSPVLFQRPRNVFDKDGVWFTREVLGKNTLARIMQSISHKAGLNEIYTCHCVRASTVTTLYQAGVDTQRICSITKHRNQSSLAHYIEGSTDSQKREASHILNKALVCNVDVPSTSEQGFPSEIPNPDLQSPDEDMRTMQLVESIPSEASVPGPMQVIDLPVAVGVANTNQQSTSSHVISVMPNCTFANCAITFQGVGGEGHM